VFCPFFERSRKASVLLIYVSETVKGMMANGFEKRVPQIDILMDLIVDRKTGPIVKSLFVSVPSQRGRLGPAFLFTTSGLTLLRADYCFKNCDNNS
jgi:hypothetical protein